MPEQFQCRFCSESYNEVLEFLDHFGTHIIQEEKELNSSLGDGQENEELDQRVQDQSNISGKEGLANLF